MLRVQEEKHLAFFDHTRTYRTSYQLTLERYLEKEEKEKANELVFKEPSLQKYKALEFWIAVRVESHFTYQWNSEYYKMELVKVDNELGSFPFSLEAYLETYSDPKIRRFKLTLHP